MKEYAFGIDLGGTTAKVGLFTTSGALLEKWEVPTDTSNAGEHILENLADAIHAKMAEKEITSEQVEGVGQFALRGGILDVFSPGLDLPVRLEFWGDEIDSLGLFDPVTQRRTAQREAVTLLPAGEEGWFGPQTVTLQGVEESTASRGSVQSVFLDKEGQTITRQNGSVEWTAIKRTHDGRYQAVADEGENGFDATKAATFLQSVYEPTFTPEEDGP